MCEALKSNTTLTELHLSGENKRKKDTPKTFINKSLVPFLFTSTDHEIGDTGATSLSEALKSNTTLTELNLGGECKRKKTPKTSINNSLFSFSLLINRQKDWGSRSNIIE